jgi:Arc/MetJ-type ribon-helix-helix transcriptional regulator
MIIELNPEQEKIVRTQLATGRFSAVDEILTTALASLPSDRRFESESRREAVRRMIEFGKRRKLNLGEPVTRGLLHDGHRF